MTLFKEWLLFALGAFVAYRNNIIGIGILFGGLFLLDLITGVVAARLREELIVSKKLRWSFVKLFCYLGSFSMTLFIGGCLNQVEFFMEILKVVVYAAVYIECLSILENFLSMFPNFTYLRWLHLMMSVKWIKRVTGLKNIMIETPKK